MLPAGYRRLSYLESTGTQYINTDYIPTTQTGLRVECSTEDDNDYLPFATRNDSGDTRFACVRRRCGAQRRSSAGYGWGAWVLLSLTGETKITRTHYIGQLNWLNSGRVTFLDKINGDQAEEPLQRAAVTPKYPLYLFACNVGGEANYLLDGKIYQADISERGSVKATYVPALDPTGAPCMYDIVTRKPFYNKGTGDFIYPTQSATYSLRRVLPDWGKLTEHGLRRLYHTPVWYKGELYDYALENGYKPIVESEKPEEGYWTPKWVESSDEIVLEWIETEEPTEV